MIGEHSTDSSRDHLLSTAKPALISSVNRAVRKLGTPCNQGLKLIEAMLLIGVVRSEFTGARKANCDALLCLREALEELVISGDDKAPLVALKAGYIGRDLLNLPNTPDKVNRVVEGGSVV